MMLLAVLSALCGALIGLRFGVVALLPAAAASLVLIAGGGLILGAGLAHIALAFVIAAVTLQLGFLGGAAFRTHTPDLRRPPPRFLAPFTDG
jgi:hypothetical protein